MGHRTRNLDPTAGSAGSSSRESRRSWSHRCLAFVHGDAGELGRASSAHQVTIAPFDARRTGPTERRRRPDSRSPGRRTGPRRRSKRSRSRSGSPSRPDSRIGRTRPAL